MLRSVVSNPEMRKSKAPALAPDRVSRSPGPGACPLFQRLRKLLWIHSAAFSAPSRLEIENLSGWWWGQEEPLRHKLCYSHCFTQTWIFVPWCKFWGVGANLFWTKEFWSEKNKIWDGKSGFPSCAFEHLPLPTTPHAGSLPMVGTNFKENFLGCLPVTEVKERAEMTCLGF